MPINLIVAVYLDSVFMGGSVLLIKKPMPVMAALFSYLFWKTFTDATLKLRNLV